MPARVLSPEQEFFKKVKAGDLDRVSELLAETPELARTLDATGATALHHAAWKGHAEIAGLLLKAGAEVNALWDDAHYGGTPLHAAAHGNQKAAAEVLIQHGADLHAISANGRSVMQETTLHNARTVANLLRKHGLPDPPPGAG
jgi:ankyrin repeat protein